MQRQFSCTIESGEAVASKVSDEDELYISDIGCGSVACQATGSDQSCLLMQE